MLSRTAGAWQARDAGVVALVAILAGCAAPPLRVDSRPGTDSGLDTAWSYVAATSLELGEDDALALGLRITARLEGEPAPALPARLADDGELRAVAVSLWTGTRPAVVATGMGHGLGEAADAAADALRAAGAADAPAVALKIDVIEPMAPAQPWSWGMRVPEPERVTDGLAGLIIEPGGMALLAEEIVAARLVDREGRLRRTRVARHARSRRVAGGPWLDEHARLWLQPFSAQSFLVADGRARALVRGHVREPDRSPEALAAAVTAAAAYLVRAVDAEGRFTYSYDARRDRRVDGYNMVRHAGTVFAMLEVHGAFGDASVLAAAERAIGYMTRFVVPYGPAEQGAFALVHDRAIKLGGVALAALALCTHAEVTGRREHVARAQALGRYILASQRGDGSFVHKRAHPGGAEHPFVSQYYPGEALLALVALHRVDRDPRWLDAAEAGARYLIEVRDRGVPAERLPHDHWLLYALEGLWRARPEPLYAEHALRLARAIMAAQVRDPLVPDEAGSFAVPPRSTPVATRNEGLLAAYRLARALGRDDEAGRILDAVMRGARVHLAMHVDAPRAMYLPDPRAALGGVTRSYTRFDIRIDYVQHSISALLALREALLGPPRRKEASRSDAPLRGL